MKSILIILLILCLLSCASYSLNINTSTRSNSYVFSEIPESEESVESILNSEPEADIDEDNSKENILEEKSQGIQFMITNRMKKELISELGYLPEEVEDLVPQIAAVIIERKLTRPLNGMPDSWKLSNITKSKQSTNIIGQYFRGLSLACSNFTNKIIQFTKIHLVPLFLPLVIGSIGIIVAKFIIDSNILHILTSSIGKISKNIIKKSNKTKITVKKPRINLNLLSKLQEPNVLENVKIKFDLLKNKYF